MYVSKQICFLLNFSLQNFTFSSLVYILLITKFTRFFDGKLISQMKRVKKKKKKNIYFQARKIIFRITVQDLNNHFNFLITQIYIRFIGVTNIVFQVLLSQTPLKTPTRKRKETANFKTEMR